MWDEILSELTVKAGKATGWNGVSGCLRDPAEIAKNGRPREQQSSLLSIKGVVAPRNYVSDAIIIIYSNLPSLRFQKHGDCGVLQPPNNSTPSPSSSSSFRRSCTIPSLSIPIYSFPSSSPSSLPSSFPTSFTTLPTLPKLRAATFHKIYKPRYSNYRSPI